MEVVLDGGMPEATTENAYGLRETLKHRASKGPFQFLAEPTHMHQGSVETAAGKHNCTVISDRATAYSFNVLLDLIAVAWLPALSTAANLYFWEIKWGGGMCLPVGDEAWMRRTRAFTAREHAGKA
ncbi:hypothetical protein NDU88_007254 [Pleurodeles waltl]|uniref:Uncharacterized protein n=1 Tax=Pleurodeles waltl TaxID=8319 RepID=A0AAV7QN73_PLEWA|nr:hypothetical protein NDU88_007254 [Pleurodeles waltl]